MTTVSATQYNSYYSATQSKTASTAYNKTASTAQSTSTGATNVTLSDEAKSTLSGKDFATVIAEAREKLDELMSDAKVTSPFADGQMAIDLNKLDRRELFAIASNADDQFTEDEQKAAAIALQDRFDAALKGPAAVARVTDEVADIYKAALDFLTVASAEEKQTPAWAEKKAAVEEALRQLAADPAQPPDVESDPVADYLKRIETGDVSEPRPFSDVASDARTALDKQYAEAKANGKILVFRQGYSNGQLADFSKFDSRSISAIALNQDGKFSAQEMSSAKSELHARSGAALLACIKNTTEGDPTGLSKNIISAFNSLSSEVREAAGWSPELYNAALANYESSAKMADMFKQLTSSNTASGFFGTGGGSSGNSGGTSLLDFL
jgi:hypothetical protein